MFKDRIIIFFIGRKILIVWGYNSHSRLSELYLSRIMKYEEHDNTNKQINKQKINES